MTMIEETNRLSENFKKSGRAGFAGGLTYNDAVSHSLTKVTKKDSTFFLQNPRSVGLTCVYQNDNNQIKQFQGVYNDVFAHRMNKKQKTRYVKNNRLLQNILIDEMLSRIDALCIALRFGLIETNSKANLCLSLLKKGNDVMQKNLLQFETCSKFENVLLS